MAIYGTVMGIIGKDAEVFNYGSEGRQGVRFSVASQNSRAYQDENPETTWVNVTFFRGNENFASKLYKGRLVTIQGEMEQLTNNNGDNYQVQIIGNDIMFGPEYNNNRQRRQQQGSGAYGASENFNGGTDDIPVHNNNQSNQVDPFANNGKPVDIQDDDIPY